MTKLHTLIKIAALSLLTLPFAVQADSWSCRHDNDVREIHVESDNDSGVPCRVVYKKLTEGVEDQTLWTANNDADYCSDKAAAFATKQEGWGWTCVETIAQEATADAPMDTPADMPTEAPMEKPAQ